MKKSTKALAAVMALAVTAGIFTGCSSSKKEGDKKELTKVKVSEVTHSVFYAPPVRRHQSGFF